MVYPRVCGGTLIRTCSPPGVCGLSPRMRGNPGAGWQARRDAWSIPAYAGEPLRHHRRRKPEKVYPRVCGGTRAGPKPSTRTAGLSPRMRGNQVTEPPAPAPPASIPAYAGEPRRVSPLRKPTSVYPRVCGGTPDTKAKTAPLIGLSPRMRGNPRYQGENRPFDRSIPAYAGEPTENAAQPKYVKVYPRVCGGTLRLGLGNRGRQGLSPRMRGNRGGRKCACRPEGSIPAYAGEPLQAGCTD